MITETQQFFIDVLREIPLKNSTLLIQSPHEEVLSILHKIKYKEVKPFKSINLNKRNREILIFEVLHNDIEEYIQGLEIWVDRNKVFEGYDGMEFGTFSKDFSLSKRFKTEYADKDMYTVSKEW